MSSSKTTTLDYWLNWRFLLCATWVFSSMTLASILIWKYEGLDGQEEESQQDYKHNLNGDESWRPCLKQIHPAWLLGFRVVAFFLLTLLLIVYVTVEGTQSFYYYTQWTFTLVVIYFGLGSLLSIYGSYQFHTEVNSGGDGGSSLDDEHCILVAPIIDEINGGIKRMRKPILHEENQFQRSAGILGYVLQILYQTNAGAVMLTDCVFWLIIVPFLEMKDYDLNLLLIAMHSLNAVFLLGDAALNSLRFPWFRISYFIMWTGIYVIFEWVVHASFSIWWPYPILDLSSKYSPIWYLFVALLHIPCYAIFFLVIRMKQSILSNLSPPFLPVMK